MANDKRAERRARWDAERAYRRKRDAALGEIREEHKDDPELQELFKTADTARQLHVDARAAEREARDASRAADAQLTGELLQYLDNDLRDPKPAEAK